MKAAKANLIHPCMRYVILEKMEDGAAHLAKQFGSALRPMFQELADKDEVDNKEPYNERVSSQMNNATIVAELRRRLKTDIEIYDHAVKHYEDQWTRPLESCNEFV